MTRNSAGQVSHISPCRTAPVVCESASSSSPISGHTIRVMVSVIVASCLPQCWAIDCCPKPLILLPLLIDLETGRIHAVTHARGSKSALRRGRWLFGQKYLTCFSSIWILSSWQATVSRSCKISPSCQILRQCDVPIRSWFVLLRMQNCYLWDLTTCSAASAWISFFAAVNLLQSIDFTAAHSFSLWKIESGHGGCVSTRSIT